MGILGLQGRIEVFQALAQLGGALGLVDVVEDRPVVFIVQDDDALAGRGLGSANQIAKTASDIIAGPVATQTEAFGALPQQLFDAHLQHPAGEVEPDDGVAARPVPTVMNIEAPKQGLAALEDLLEGVQKQALAEAAWAGEEVIDLYLI